MGVVNKEHWKPGSALPPQYSFLQQLPKRGVERDAYAGRGDTHPKGIQALGEAVPLS